MHPRGALDDGRMTLVRSIDAWLCACAHVGIEHGRKTMALAGGRLRVEGLKRRRRWRRAPERLVRSRSQERPPAYNPAPRRPLHTTSRLLPTRSLVQAKPATQTSVSRARSHGRPKHKPISQTVFEPPDSLSPSLPRRARTSAAHRAAAMAPKKKEEPKERPILGRFKTNLKVRERRARSAGALLARARARSRRPNVR